MAALLCPCADFSSELSCLCMSCTVVKGAEISKEPGREFVGIKSGPLQLQVAVGKGPEGVIGLKIPTVICKQIK